MRNEEPEKHVDESEFADMAGSPAEARAIRKALEMVAGGGAGGTLKEMAQEVLTGRIGLREALNVSAYTEQMVDQTQSIRERWDGLSGREREAMAAAGEGYLEEQQREIDDERTEQLHGDPHRKTKPRHSM
jgi:cell division protein ZapA (FtsZ GTPase activity inhibitor)